MYKEKDAVPTNIEVEIAREVARTTATNGWKEIRKWIDERIEKLSEKILSNSTLSETKEIVVKESKAKKEITIINVVNNIELAEVKALKTFIRKIEDWEKIATQK